MKSLSLLISTVILSALMAAGPSIAKNANELDKAICHFFPANKFRFPVSNDPRQMTHAQFKKILAATESVYKPLFARLGLGNLNITERWSDDRVDACASFSAPCSARTADPFSKDRFVEIYGGLARHPNITPEGLMVAICHEIGHHLGGYPRYQNNENDMSTEGQADYFATAKCSRLIYEALSPKSNENWLWTYKSRIPQEVIAPCLANFNTQSVELIYCARSSIAGYSLAQVLSATAGEDPKILSFSRKDPAVVQTTFEGHSQAQCRLDTYTAGAICRADPRTPFSMTNPIQGACANQGTDGSRPACWFKNLSRAR